MKLSQDLVFSRPSEKSSRAETAGYASPPRDIDAANASRAPRCARCAGARREGADIARGGGAEARIFGDLDGLAIFKGVEARRKEGRGRIEASTGRRAGSMHGAIDAASRRARAYVCHVGAGGTRCGGGSANFFESRRAR